MIEAILILPILVMLSFGLVEYGWAFYVKHQVAAAAYVGARNAITTGATNATVTTAVAASMQAAGFQPSQYTLTTSPTTVAGASAGTYMTVTVAVTWSIVGVSPLPVAMGGLPPTKQLSCSVLMSHE
jgi:Flp pilus assembly protein TadG